MQTPSASYATFVSRDFYPTSTPSPRFYAIDAFQQNILLPRGSKKRRNPPPVSKLEALALRVEERRSTSESADVDEAEERPDRLRSRLRLKARSASEPEQPFSDVSKLAKGPDGTTGFLRARTIKPFGFSAEVAEFVPSFLPADPPPGGGNIY